jgi:hypothetical protein
MTLTVIIFWGCLAAPAILILATVKEDRCTKWRRENPHATGKCPFED